MKKTGSQIEKDVYNLVKVSPLAAAVNGSVFRDGMRTPNSSAEDIVVIFITALDGDNQVGRVNINIYVPNIDGGGFGLKNSKRCEEVEILCQTFVESLTTNEYLFSLGQMIHTFEEEDIKQHFINAKIDFKFNTKTT